MKYSYELVLLYFVLVYFIIFILGVIYNKEFSIGLLIAQAVVHAFFLGFRDISVGYDTSVVYVPAYLGLIDAGWQKGLFLGINHILGFLGADYNVYLFIICLITSFNLCISYVVLTEKKNTNMIVCSVFGTSALILLFINGIRQGLAISFFLLSFSLYYSSEVKIKRIFSLILFLLAVSVHTSTFVLFPVYFICNKKLNYKILLGILVISIIFSINKSNIILILNLLPFEDLKSHFLGYIGTYNNSNNIYKYLIHLTNLVVLVYLSNKNINSKWFVIIRNTYTYMLIVAILASVSGETAKRFMWNMSLFIPLIYNQLINILRPKRISKLIYIVCSIIYIMIILSHPSIKSNFNYM